jgi:signal transduction histidine kinase
MPAFESLQQYIAARRDDILERWIRRVTNRLEGGDLSKVELLDHMPGFLNELVEALRAGPRTDTRGLPRSDTGTEHGRQRLRVGFEVDEVVREYGLLGDVILQEVEAAGGQLDAREARVFHAQLNAGAAEAVTAYVQRRDEEVRRQSARHRSFVAHELRTPLSTATTALAVLRRTRPEVGGDDTAGLISRSLAQLRELVDQVLIEGRLDAGAPPACEPVDFAALVRQAAEESGWHARSRDVRIVVAVPDALPGIGDRRLLLSTIENLLRNAIKYSRRDTDVTLSATRRGDDVVVEVSDGCGGFAPAPGVDVFEPFVQAGDDRTGFGLGLAIARQAAQAHGGDIVFRNAPPLGCVFTLQLPAGGPPDCC